MKITCLGYKTAFTGDKMYHYKMEYKKKEFLIIDANMIRLLDMVWTEENEFENASPDIFSYKFLDNDIVNALKDVKKKRKELVEDEEKTFFTQHVVVPKVVKKKVRKKLTYSDDEVNDILSLLGEYNIEYNGKGTITQQMADETREDYDGLLDDLVGYKVKIRSTGDHRNDGQFVDYDFTFTSPAGKKTEFSTEMCLMVGWNYHESLKFN